MLRSVRDSFVDGAKWNAVGTFGHYLVSFFISIILSRLLSPAEFGSVAMLTIFIEVAKEFINSGFVVALVQKKECSEDDYSTVFIFNIVVGLFLYGVMFVSAPFISDFYDMPELTKLVRYQSLIIVVGSFGLVQTAIMLRDIFKDDFYLEIQDHGIPEQKKINPFLIKLSKELNIPLVCTNDVHYTYADDVKPHDLLLCLQTGKKVTDTDRLRYEGGQYYVKSEEEMKGLFPYAWEAVENTRQDEAETTDARKTTEGKAEKHRSV